jgi:RNA polymerase sigma factor (sigma-70 family)
VARYSNREILCGIESRDKLVAEYIYKKCFPIVQNNILLNSGTVEDARDIFNDAILIVYRKLEKEQMVLNCNFCSFIYSICKNLWLKFLERKKVNYRYLNSYENRPSQINGIGFVEEMEDQEQYCLMYKYIGRLDEKCKNILLMYFAEKSCSEMSAKLDISNSDLVRKLKYKCKEKLAKMIRQDPMYKEIAKHESYEKFKY